MLQLRSSFGKAFSRKKRDTSVSRSNSIGSARVDPSMSHTWSMPTISDPTCVGQRYSTLSIVTLRWFASVLCFDQRSLPLTDVDLIGEIYRFFSAQKSIKYFKWHINFYRICPTTPLFKNSAELIFFYIAAGYAEHTWCFKKVAP